MKIQAVLDRMGDERAVIEGLGNVPTALIPASAKEGDLLEVLGDDDQVVIRLASAARSSVLSEVEALKAAAVKLDVPDDALVEL